MANVGYYDMDLGQGQPSQVAAILLAGSTPRNITIPNATQLGDVDILLVNNPSNGQYAAEYRDHLDAILQRVNDGMTLVIHDRFVTGADTILPGTVRVLRDFGDDSDIEIVEPALASGPGGTITNGSLDGGTSSSHGYILASTLPPGAEILLTRSDPDRVVTFSYPVGAGRIVYSTIPLDFYLATETDLGLGMQAYAANLLEYLEAVIVPSEPPTEVLLSATAVDELAETGTVIGTLSAEDPDLPDETLFFTLLDDWGGRLAIGGASGTDLIVADSLLLDFEQEASHDITVRVRDRSGNVLDRSFTITLGNVEPEAAGGDDRGNTLVGGALNDVFDGLAGADDLSGGGGNDALSGGLAEDRLAGGDGEDSLRGDQQDDVLAGGAGNDRLLGGQGADRLLGEDGDDLLRGGNQAGEGDILNGGTGFDTASYAQAQDAVVVNLADPALNGGAAAGDVLKSVEAVLLGGQGDSFSGDDGRNLARGGAGDDDLSGLDGSDSLRGDAGADTLDGGSGNDRLTGDADADSFVFSGDWGRDTITDFADGTDRIAFVGVAGLVGFADLAITEDAGGATVSFNGQSIRLPGLTAAGLDAADFSF